MISKLFSHLCLLIIFLLGSTISCVASLNTSLSDGPHTEHIQQGSNDDCCPKDGHKKEIDIHGNLLSLEKQGNYIEPFIPQKEMSFSHDIPTLSVQTNPYCEPEFDKQSLFFTDTIRLII